MVSPTGVLYPMAAALPATLTSPRPDVDALAGGVSAVGAPAV